MRLIELTSALSLATDAGTGQPFEHALRTALLSVHAADALGLSPADKSTVLYTTLLRFVGCTSTASESAALAGGDDLGFNATMAPLVMADDREALLHLIRHLGDGLPLGRRVVRVAAALSDPGGKARAWCAECCWALMASLFALGIMSILWMAVIAGLIAFEKTVPWRRIASYGTAALLLALGMLVLTSPGAVPGLTTLRVAPMQQMGS